MSTSSQNPESTGLRARVPEKNSQLVALAERADRRMEKARNSRVPLSLADLEFMKNDVHEAVELGHKARFLWLSADERADNLGRQLFDARAEAARDRAEIQAEVLRKFADRLASRASLYGNSQTVIEVIRDIDRLIEAGDEL
ncbi:hypothetical protein ACFY2M_19630 [Streptomyces sp. NPDC001276]|uniref:hypothetical protein n=1 Tax=Streptomyces sp. NPDC001276 TaxID=3364555 RepID=UPI0036AE6D08